MTKKEKARYDRQIGNIADSLLIDAYRHATDITEDVYLDILLHLRSRIDESLQRIQEREKQEK